MPTTGVRPQNNPLKNFSVTGERPVKKNGGGYNGEEFFSRGTSGRPWHPGKPVHVRSIVPVSLTVCFFVLHRLPRTPSTSRQLFSVAFPSGTLTWLLPPSPHGCHHKDYLTLVKQPRTVHAESFIIILPRSLGFCPLRFDLPSHLRRHGIIVCQPSSTSKHAHSRPGLQYGGSVGCLLGDPIFSGNRKKASKKK